jgi:2-dehydropantoate 2-reductase
MEKVLFLGMGAVGITFASQFVDAGHSVQFLCDEKRREKYRNQDLSVNGRSYAFSFVVPSEISEAPDFVFVAVKEYQLESALGLLEGVAGPQTVVLSLLNGIDSEETIAGRLGSEKVLPAFVSRMDSTKERDKVVYSSPGQIVFGERDGKRSARVERVERLLADAKVLHEASGEIMRMMWWKFMVNVGMNQAGAILRAPYGHFQEFPPCLEVAFSAMREVISLAPFSGVDLSERDIDRSVQMLMRFNPEGKNSMLQDLDAGRKTEVEIFAGKICRLGEEAGIPTPVNRLFYNMLKTLEWQNSRHQEG